MKYTHNEVRRIFDLVFDAVPERRDTVLDAECGADADLRHRIVTMIATAEDD